VQLAISDAHGGLKAAIAKVLGCAWQRCTVHYADPRVMPTRAWKSLQIAGSVALVSA
jgi:transposase-like protein